MRRAVFSSPAIGRGHSAYFSVDLGRVNRAVRSRFVVITIYTTGLCRLARFWSLRCVFATVLESLRYALPVPQRVLALIDRHRAELQQEALRLGERFFAERTTVFVRGLKGCWAYHQEQGTHSDSRLLRV